MLTDKPYILVMTIALVVACFCTLVLIQGGDPSPGLFALTGGLITAIIIFVWPRAE